ncbi:hypothetical protein IAD21_04296 [Abditibacteriota bacterium]|nr:hypothetical protein IAD21_04296 [Abditibacteriota bacterium]
MKFILLDTGPLGVYTNPKPSPQKQQVEEKIEEWESKGYLLVVPEIADFEVRRELLRSQKVGGLKSLDAVGERFIYLPLTTEAMRLAAQLWAEARQQGQPTAAPFELDGDVILSAQAQALGRMGSEVEVIVATFNTRHISRYITAMQPVDIT